MGDITTLGLAVMEDDDCFEDCKDLEWFTIGWDPTIEELLMFFPEHDGLMDYVEQTASPQRRLRQANSSRDHAA